MIHNLRSFRCVAPPEYMPLVLDLLAVQGFVFTPEPFCDFVFRLEYEPFPLGSSLASIFGYIYIQDRSSMLPPLVLAPQAGGAVLDMCASPGSKTGMLAQLAGPEGFILANEPSRNRLATLRHNLVHLNLFSCATMSHAGEALPLPSATLRSGTAFSPTSAPYSSGSTAEGEPEYEGWSYIQLDPPCSGWGTIEKNPKVMDLWQADKIAPLIRLQQRLLAEAFRLLRPGGRVVYSTCTTNTAENEDQLRYACDTLGFTFLPAFEPAGFSFVAAALPQFEGVLRVATGQDGQGFFVALLEKPLQAAVPKVAESVDATPPSRQRPPGLRNNFQRNPYGKYEKPRPYRAAAKGMCNEPVPRELLASAGVDVQKLPPGELHVFSDVVHFLPAPAKQLIPQGFVWKAFPLGRMGARGEIRVNPTLRGLMPSLKTAEEQNLPLLNLESTHPLTSLLSGASLAVSVATSELLLYFRGLPLCRLVVKKGRALLPQSSRV